MANHLSDYIIIQRLSEGDNRVFTAFYKENREPFFRHFIMHCQSEEKAGFIRMKFKSGDMYLDDLYQTSCIRLYEMVNFGKLHVLDSKVYYQNRKGDDAPLTCSLLTLLKNIGFNVLKEMERDNADSNTSNLDDVLRTSENEECAPDSLLQDEEEEDLKVAITRRLLEKMTETCRKIFTALYLNDSDGKVKGVEVVERLGYSSPESFRNQKARCVNKFKVAFQEELKKNNGFHE